MAVLLAAAPAFPVAQEIMPADTALLFGGTDAEGGIGDWYVSNGVIEAIIDDADIQGDLTAVVGSGSEPPIQAAASPTGGTLLDLGTVGDDNDQINQMFTVGGLSTENFALYDAVSAPSSDTIRVSGKLLLPPVSPPSAPCVDIVTDYKALGTDAFLTVVTTATNGCTAPVSLGGFLDVFLWVSRSLIPFSGGGSPPLGAKGFNHPVLDLSNPIASVELPVFLSAPGLGRPADGIADPANGTLSGEVSYGLLPVEVTKDPDGAGGVAATTTAVNFLFGVSNNLVSALGNLPSGTLGSTGGAFVRYTRRVYVGDRNDVRTVANTMIGEMATRTGFTTGTISGDIDAADTANVEASILVTRTGGPSTPGFSTGATTHIRTDSTGAFSGVVVPVGTYDLDISAPERDDEFLSVTVTASTPGGAFVSMSARGTVNFTVREKTGALPLIPAKLVFKGVSPTVDPRFNKDLSATLGGDDVLPETFGGTQDGTSGDAAGQNNIVYTATGSGGIQVRPGTYDVYASRGNEYSIDVVRVTVPSGGAVSADFLIKRVVKTKKAISADFHVHSARSFDSSAPLVDRVRSFAAEGVEVIVSTDHDKIVDYSTVITGLGLGSRITSIVGDEVTGSVPAPPAFPNSYGHINAWPLTVQKDERADGAIQDEFVAPNWLFSRLRLQGAEVIQYNHPRAGVAGLTSIGYFNNIGCNRCANDIDTTCTLDTDCPAGPDQVCTCVGYQPDRVITMAPNDILLDDGVLGPGTAANPDGFDNLDFDVMEVMNAAKDTDFDDLRLVRRDWLSLLNQGIFRGGTAVSDSHRNTIEHAGWARSYVVNVSDDPATLSLAAFNQQVKAGSMVMSGGPYIDFSIKPKPGKKVLVGQTLASPPGGAVKLKIKVLSPAWMPIEEVHLIQNGFTVATFDESGCLSCTGCTVPVCPAPKPIVKPVPADPTVLGKTRRFRANILMTLSDDAYFIVEAGPKFPADINTPPAVPPVVDIIVPGVVPYAITNPIFVDLAGNGFDPPGLPVMSASNAPAERGTLVAGGLLERLWDRLVHVASRLTGQAVAEDAPGEMTGVTEEEKAEAVRKGEYFPLQEFRIPPEVAEQLRRQLEAEEKKGPGGTSGGGE
jgi:hypothetical protein